MILKAKAPLFAVAFAIGLPAAASAEGTYHGFGNGQFAPEVVIANPDGSLPTLGDAGAAPASLGQTDSSHSLPVVLPNDPDFRPASATITTQDIGSVTTAGQDGGMIISGTPTAGSYQGWALNGQSGVRVTVTGAWTGTLEFDGSGNGGTTRTPIPCRVNGTSRTRSSVTANGLFYCDVGQLTHLYVRSTGAMTGTATVQAAAGSAGGPQQVLNPIRIIDNSSGAELAIKPGSTPPATTDPSAVVGIADGNDVTKGALADAACGTDTGPCTQQALTKRLLSRITTLLNSLTNAGSSATAGLGVQGINNGIPQNVNPDSVPDNAVGTSASLTGIGTFTFASGLPTLAGSSNQTIVTAGYAYGTFQLASNPGGDTIGLYGSNDGTNWTTLWMHAANTGGGAAGNASGTVSTTAGTGFEFKLWPYVQLRTTAGAGAAQVSIGLKRNAFSNVVDAYVGNTVTVQKTSFQVFADTTTTLGSSATFTGTTRDTNTLSINFTMFGATFYADQAGTGFIDESTDGSTWFMVQSVAVTAGSGALVGPIFSLNTRIRARYYRTRFINGAVAQGAFRITSSFTAN